MAMVMAIVPNVIGTATVIGIRTTIIVAGLVIPIVSRPIIIGS